MLRHVRWGLIFSLSLLIALAYAAPYWLDLLEPLRPATEQAAQGFVCPPNFTPEVCNLLEKIDQENPLEAAAMTIALQSDPVPAPANEVDPASMEEDINRETVSAFNKTLIRTGQFIELDALHHASGTVNIWELVADGAITRYLRFEDGFELAQGPDDLQVYLTINLEPPTPEEMLPGTRAVQIGYLKGNVGAQNYKLSSDIDVTQYRGVVVFSPQFGRVFSFAPLEQPIQ